MNNVKIKKISLTIFIEYLSYKVHEFIHLKIIQRANLLFILRLDSIISFTNLLSSFFIQYIRDRGEFINS